MFSNGSKDENNIHREAGKQYLTLRTANIARQAEWDPSGHAKDLFWRMNELAGETGELCNILKKLHRERVGIPGSRATKDQLADEAADILICIDLLAIDCGIDANQIRTGYRAFSGRVVFRSLPHCGTLLTKRLGRVAEVLCDADEQGGLSPSRVDRMALCLAALQAYVMQLCVQENIDLHMAVENKFNATTTKVGLSTYLNLE